MSLDILRTSAGHPAFDLSFFVLDFRPKFVVKYESTVLFKISPSLAWLILVEIVVPIDLSPRYQPSPEWAQLRGALWPFTSGDSQS